MERGCEHAIRATGSIFGQLGNYLLFLKQLGNFDFNRVINNFFRVRVFGLYEWVFLHMILKLIAFFYQINCVITPIRTLPVALCNVELSIGLVGQAQ